MNKKILTTSVLVMTAITFLASFNSVFALTGYTCCDISTGSTFGINESFTVDSDIALGTGTWNQYFEHRLMRYVSFAYYLEGDPGQWTCHTANSGWLWIKTSNSFWVGYIETWALYEHPFSEVLDMTNLEWNFAKMPTTWVSIKIDVGYRIATPNWEVDGPASWTCYDDSPSLTQQEIEDMVYCYNCYHFE